MSPVKDQVPPFAIAASLCLRLSGFIFGWISMTPPGPAVDEPRFKNWYLLRLSAQRLLDAHGKPLPPEQREELLGAIHFAHVLGHQMHQTTSHKLSLCTCATATAARDLLLLMATMPSSEEIPA